MLQMRVAISPAASLHSDYVRAVSRCAPVSRAPLILHQHQRRVAGAFIEVRVCCCCSSGSTSGCDALGSFSTARQVNDGDVVQAWALLREFSRQQVKGTGYAFLSDVCNRHRLREALKVATSRAYPPAAWVPDAAPGIMLGILAGDARMALRAYRDWCDAFGLIHVTPVSRVDHVTTIAMMQGPVYIKYIAEKQGGYFSAHFGKDRGVLVQLGTDQLGLFPLGLFDEDMQKPAPLL